MFRKRYQYAGVVTPLPWKSHRFFASSSVGSTTSQQEEKKEMFVTEFEEDGVEFGYLAGDTGKKTPAIRQGGKILRRTQVMMDMTSYHWDPRLKMWSV